MELNDFFSLIKGKKQTVISVLLVFFILSVIFTAIQPFKYGSESKVLVVQNYAIGTDPYVASKSNEYLSSILANVVVSNLFFNEVLNSGFNVNKDYFYGSTKKQMKKWQNTAQAKAISDTGIISIKVFHKDKYQAEQISEAINYILKSKHGYYHGGGDNVVVKVIDKPIVSNLPVKPNVILNLLLGIILGLILGLSYIYLFPEEKYNLKIWRWHRKNKKEKESKITNNGNLDNIQGNLKENIDVFDKKDSYSNNKSDERNFNNYEKSLNNTDKEKDEKDFYNNLDSGNIEEKGNINNLFGRSNLDND